MLRTLPALWLTGGYPLEEVVPRVLDDRSLDIFNTYYRETILKDRSSASWKIAGFFMHGIWFPLPKPEQIDSTKPEPQPGV